MSPTLFADSKINRVGCNQTASMPSVELKRKSYLRFRFDPTSFTFDLLSDRESTDQYYPSSILRDILEDDVSVGGTVSRVGEEFRITFSAGNKSR